MSFVRKIPPPPPIPSPPSGVSVVSTSTPQFALRFISGKYQGGEYLVPQGKEVIIGRATDSEVPIVEQMVSRHHAKLFQRGNDLIIEDLRSTNGTFVNGERITQATVLREGDRILIGSSILEVVKANREKHAPQSLMPPKSGAISSQMTSQIRTMAGSVAEVPLPDLLQLFGGTRKTGELVVTNPQGDVGRIFLEQGRIVYAVLNDRTQIPPLKSMIRMLLWEDGTFEMKPFPQEPFEFPQRLDMAVEDLLMEALRQIDEIKRFGDDLPPLHASIHVPMPLLPPLRELSPEELDVLQLAYNYGTVEDVLNESLASDVETTSILVKLIKSGYLSVEC
ncbi:MAG: DUF4388 domain-containing protein [Sandaracinaceae bacterium]|nr:DUF4388 domain-containing protein [Sandaracinaceae bacterium]